MRSGVDGGQDHDGHDGNVCHDGHASRHGDFLDGDDESLVPRIQSPKMNSTRMRKKRRMMNALFFHASREEVPLRDVHVGHCCCCCRIVAAQKVQMQIFVR